MATMNKPTYAAILEHSPTKPALVFVSSRRQTRLTALDLIAYCASDDDPKQFLHMPDEEIEAIAATLQDRALRDTIVFGVALHHAGLSQHDRKTVEELFFSAKLQVLVCTSTLAWGVNLPCHLVVVKGTEFFDAKQSRYVDMPVTDVLQMMGRAGRPQFDDTGVACIMVHEPKKTFYKKFLHEPFPVESSLHLQLHSHLSAEIATGSLHTLRDCIEWLTWTYYFRRLLMNPAYYGLKPEEEASEYKGGPSDGVLSSGETGDISAAAVERHLTQLLTSVTADLHNAGCIDIDKGDAGESGNLGFSTTYLGKIASVYYLHYQTVGLIRDRLYEIDDEDAAHDATATHTDADASATGQAGRGKGKGRSEGGRDRGDRVDTRYRYQLWQLLFVLCSTPEFAELPVRHNEEHLNMQLAEELCVLMGDAPRDECSALSFISRRSSFESPHCKAFLLLLAHSESAPLPISDYINDTKTVLDQVARVSKAMVDVAGEEGLLDIVLR
ncbi:P-loop containing nucleoside triphosphate hydrolase protein [Ochromonadaceae sp. CCMP2298]|nr:P-loop containing nucleoside triphosphate hydrolase protein [Ochromonadaceae sp. CCMP2298]